MSGKCMTVAAALCLSVGYLRGQVTFLTGREAKELVELVPEVAASRARGECPTISLGPPIDTSAFALQARGACWSPGDPESLLINNYTVDRKTGSVIIDGSKSVVSTPEMRGKARATLAAAAARRLSVAESRCLVVEAVKAVLGLDERADAPSMTTLPAIDTVWEGFQIEDSRGTGHGVTGRLYYVSRETGIVWDEQAGVEVTYAALGALRSRILALREAPVLSLEDALTVALRIPSISGKLSRGCITLDASDTNSSGDDVYIGIRNQCGGAGNGDEVAAAVNLLTGAVSNPRTGATLQTPEADRVANEILLRIRASQMRERRTINTQCRIGQ